MAKTDIPSKRLIQLKPDDWAKFALNTNEEIRLEEMKSEKNPKVESRLDSLFWIESEKERFILNLEPQGYYDKSLAARMLRYRADIWEYTTWKNLGTPSIKQVVIFFYEKDDNNIHELNDDRKGNNKIDYSYDVLRVWEIKKAYVIDNRLEGLYSLLPLMKKETNETDEEIIENTVRIIETIEDEALRQDSLAAMVAVTSDKYSSTLIRKYVRREMLMNSPLFKEWAEEERKEAAIDINKSKIIEILTKKFDFIPKDIKKDLDQIDDIGILDNLFSKAIDVKSIEEFRALLEKAKRIM